MNYPFHTKNSIGILRAQKAPCCHVLAFSFTPQRSASAQAQKEECWRERMLPLPRIMMPWCMLMQILSFTASLGLISLSQSALSSLPHEPSLRGGKQSSVFYSGSLLASKCNNLPLFPSRIGSVCCFFCAKHFVHVCQGSVLFWGFPLFILCLLFRAQECNLKSFSRKFWQPY